MTYHAAALNPKTKKLEIVVVECDESGRPLRVTFSSGKTYPHAEVRVFENVTEEKTNG